MYFVDGALPETREDAIDAYAQFIQEARDAGAQLAYERAMAAGASEDVAVDHALAARQVGEDYAQRTLCQLDLFYLLVFVCGRSDINRDWLFDRCREVQESNDRTLDLWARYHYKSSIITFGLTIQEILRDPEITICIFSDVNKVARPFLAQIKREFEQNGLLKRLFPDILWTDPENEAPTWSEEKGIVVKRRGNPKELTVEAYGLIDGMPTGRHFALRVYDDLVTINSITSPEMMKKVAERLALSHALGIENGGRFRIAGTRYHGQDAYQRIIDDKLAWLRLHPATHDGTESGRPVLLTPEALADARSQMGPFTFAAQMLMNPTADRAMAFNEEWLRYWPGDNRANMNIYIVVDPSSGRKGKGPAGNDYTAMWVVGAGADRNFYILDHLRERLSLTQRTAKLFELVREFRPAGVGYEEYGMQGDIDHIHAEQARQNVRFAVVPLGGKLAKPDRIRRLMPLFEQGRVLLPSALIRVDREGRSYAPIRLFIEQEYRPFPVGTHDDSLDALSRMLDDDLGVIWPEMMVNDSRAPMRGALSMQAVRRALEREQVHDWRGG